MLSHVLNTGYGGIDVFEVKLTFELLTVRGQQHSFSTHERMFLFLYAYVHMQWNKLSD